MRGIATLYELFVGAALLFSPWSRMWQENWFLWNSGDLRSWLTSTPVRGAVSGFGAACFLDAASRLVRVSAVAGTGDPVAAPLVNPAPSAPRADE